MRHIESVPSRRLVLDNTDTARTLILKKLLLNGSMNTYQLQKKDERNNLADISHSTAVGTVKALLKERRIEIESTKQFERTNLRTRKFRVSRSAFLNLVSLSGKILVPEAARET